MITVGPMALNQPQAADPMEPFFLGTQSGGGYWTDISRLSSHDHSGGLMGAAVAVNIPDGSITAADLDPSVLAPYALTDGSKPFTGQVTMQADAVVRDALLFGQQGTALAPDATLSRTAAASLRLDGILMVVPPAGQAALYLNRPEAAPGYMAHLALSRAGVARFNLGLNDQDGFVLYNGNLSQQRIVVTTAGTLALAPDAAAHALTWTASAGAGRLGEGAFGTATVEATTGNLQLRAAGGVVFPSPDNTVSLGNGSLRWTAVYATTGAIQPSSRTVKEGITPLDPSRAMQAVRDTEAVTFDYVPPTRGPEWYDLPDDPEQAEAVLQQRLTAAPLEAAARHQHGFIAEQADDLFLVGEGQTSPGSSIGVLLAALQQLDARVQQLEGAA